MRTLISSIQKYKYLLILSLCSALLVVILQILVNTLFFNSVNKSSDVYLEEATGEIVPVIQQETTEQFISTLQRDELKEFQSNGQYEDKSTLQNINAIEIQLEKLLVTLDKPLIGSNNQSGETIQLKLNNNTNLDISLCDPIDSHKQSCTVYLVNKSGESIPVAIALVDSKNSPESGINVYIDSKGDQLRPGIFTSKPIQLDIRVM